MKPCEVVIVGSGFAGSLLARILAIQGYDVVLIERGTHPRFAIGESSTPLANLSLERLGIRYAMADCYNLATHGRWLAHFPEIRRGLKRGFTYYRHHQDQPFANRGLDSERLLVAASPQDSLSDTHWLRADVDHHFVRQAIAAGVDYRDRVALTSAGVAPDSVRVSGTRNGAPFELRANFLIDASGPSGFLARQLPIPSGLEKTETRSALVFSHFDGVRLMKDVVPGMPEGPYPDDWAAVHHIIDEGWMYSLRFDDGVTSAGFLLTPSGISSLRSSGIGDAATKSAATSDATTLWRAMVQRYPTLASAFAEATPLMPISFLPAIQHRLTRAVGERWAMMPHAYAFRSSRRESRGLSGLSSDSHSHSNPRRGIDVCPISKCSTITTRRSPRKRIRSTSSSPAHTRQWRISSFSPRRQCSISPLFRLPKSASDSCRRNPWPGTDSSEWGIRCSGRCRVRASGGYARSRNVAVKEPARTNGGLLWSGSRGRSRPATLPDSRILVVEISTRSISTR